MFYRWEETKPLVDCLLSTRKRLLPAEEHSYWRNFSLPSSENVQMPFLRQIHHFMRLFLLLLLRWIWNRHRVPLLCIYKGSIGHDIMINASVHSCCSANNKFHSMSTQIKQKVNWTRSIADWSIWNGWTARGYLPLCNFSFKGFRGANKVYHCRVSPETNNGELDR